MSNATKWPKMIRAVYASFGTGQHQNDDVARRVMDRIVSWLAAGKELSPRLQSRLIDNINMRTCHVVADPGAPVRLTGDQIKYAKRTNPEWFGLKLLDDPEGEREGNGGQRKGKESMDQPTIPLPLPDLSTTITLLFHHLSTAFPLQAVELAQELSRRAAELCGSGGKAVVPFPPKVMESEAKESEHEPGDMIGPEDRIALAGSRQEDELGLQPGHDVEAITSPEQHGADRDGAGSPCQDSKALSDGMSEKPAPPETARAVVSLFHRDPSRPPSANLELGDARYSLVFSDPDTVEDQLAGISSAEWCGWFDDALGATVRQEARAAGTRRTRYRLAPLYAAHDTFARKPPVVGDAVAVLLWDEQEEPEAVVLVTGETAHRIELPRFRGRSARGPSHKGQTTLRLEAA